MVAMYFMKEKSIFNTHAHIYTHTTHFLFLSGDRKLSKITLEININI